MTGKLYGLGLGPGDPELLTLKAHRILTQCPVVAYPAPDTGPSFARQIAAPYLTAAQLEVSIIVFFFFYVLASKEIYTKAAETLSHHLDAGSDVAVLCEGDPFFYGSFMYLFERLADRYPTEVVPGVSSMMAAAAGLGRPLAARNEASGAVAIINLGRHFARIRALIESLGLTAQAAYAERVSLAEQKLTPLADVAEYTAPYFSMILIYKGDERWHPALAKTLGSAV